MTKNFNIEGGIKALQSGQDLTGKDGVLTPLIKQLTEAALKAELELHLEDNVQPNRKMAPVRKQSNLPQVRLNLTHHVTVLAHLNQS